MRRQPLLARARSQQFTATGTRTADPLARPLACPAPLRSAGACEAVEALSSALLAARSLLARAGPGREGLLGVRRFARQLAGLLVPLDPLVTRLALELLSTLLLLGPGAYRQVRPGGAARSLLGRGRVRAVFRGGS